eukprot:3484062-Pyramimonas_sp.AAC.1
MPSRIRPSPLPPSAPIHPPLVLGHPARSCSWARPTATATAGRASAARRSAPRALRSSRSAT